MIKNFGIVVPKRIYRGAQPEDNEYASLKQLGVQTILDLRQNFDRQDEQEQCKALGIGYVNVPIGLDPINFGVLTPTKKQVQQCMDILQGQLGNLVTAKAQANLTPAAPVVMIPSGNVPVVFVHCAHGEYRTGAVIAAYRMIVDGWDNVKALAEAEQYCLNPLQIIIKHWIKDFNPKNA